MKTKKVLFVLTSTEKLGNTGHKTGAYLSEITRPYNELVREGIEIDMISPRGGRVPLDGTSAEDPYNVLWMKDPEFKEKIENTLRPWQVEASDYGAIYFAGGHGAMFDFPDNLQLQNLASEIYEQGGVVSSICHGAAGIVNVRLNNASYLIQGHEVTAFSNAEESTVGMHRVVPFLLESKLQEHGAHFTSAPRFTGHTVKSGRLVTGQNPASASDLGRALVETLDLLKEGHFIPSQDWCEWGHP